jgi:hypothetical protein
MVYYGNMKGEPKASPPPTSAKNETGDFAQFTNFMQKLISVPHSVIQERLAKEKRSKAASRAAASGTTSR